MNGFSFICSNILHSGENDKIQIKVFVSCEYSTAIPPVDVLFEPSSLGTLIQSYLNLEGI